MSLTKYIKESSDKAKKQMKEIPFINGITVFIKDELPQDINIKSVLSTLRKRIPNHLFSGVDVIYIGQFKNLKTKAFNAAFMDGAMYLSNEQTTEEDMVDDFVHELAHAVEEISNFGFYSDEEISDEFYAKRMKLKEILQANGYDTSKQDFSNLEYNEGFDFYLYEDIGYPALTAMTVGLFCSPYGATSIREYFANAFEYYFIKDAKYVNKVSPNVCAKINQLSKEDYFY